MATLTKLSCICNYFEGLVTHIFARAFIYVAATNTKFSLTGSSVCLVYLCTSFSSSWCCEFHVQIHSFLCTHPSHAEGEWDVLFDTDPFLVGGTLVCKVFHELLLDQNHFCMNISLGNDRYLIRVFVSVLIFKVSFELKRSHFQHCCDACVQDTS